MLNNNSSNKEVAAAEGAVIVVAAVIVAVEEVGVEEVEGLISLTTATEEMTLDGLRALMVVDTAMQVLAGVRVGAVAAVVFLATE